MSKYLLMSPVFILHANDQIHSKTYVNMFSDGSLFLTLALADTFSTPQ